MKVLQINKFFFSKGGSERYFFDLAELLAEKGHRVMVWSTQNSKNFPWPGQDSFAKFSDFSKREGLIKDFEKVKRILWNSEASRKLEKIIKEEKPDVAHLHNIFSHFSSSIIFILKKYDIPIVMTLHDYKLFCPNYKFFSNGKVCYDCLKNKNYYSCVSKKCLKDSKAKSFIGFLEAKFQNDFLKIADKIDIFLAPSLFMKKKALESGIDKEKIIHLPNFIDKDFGKGIKSSKGQAPYILYLGRLSQEKGVDLLIESFNEVKEELSDWKLKIVGDGPERNKLEILAGEEKRIKFLGKKQGKEWKQIIADAELMVIPSLWPENFPYSVLESFIFSRPIIAAKTGGLTELVKDRQNSLLFKAGSKNDLKAKLIWANDYRKELSRMGQLARKEVLAKCNPEKHYRELIKAYERIQNN